MEDGRDGEIERLREEVRTLRERLEQARDMPELASAALRKARARLDELRVAYGVSSDELARTRALLIEAWKALHGLAFSGGDGGAACPACGGSGWHAEGCPVGKALDLTRDPRPRRADLEDAIDSAWRARSGEPEGVKARLAFMDEVFAEFSRRGLVRED